MPRPMGSKGGIPEKSKDFKGSMKRLFNSLNNFRYLLVFALALGMVSAIFALIAPNKLSELTDTITLGLQPKISEEIIKDIMMNEDISENDKKEFQGGVICAGIKTSFSSLFANTSKLESTKISKPQSIIGKNTTNCVQNGMVYGTCGMIEGIIQRMREECGEFKTVLTGGEASLIQDYLREEVIIDNNLLFDGLLEIYKKNINK